MYLSLDIETNGLEINTQINYIGAYTEANGKEYYKIWSMPKDLEDFRTFINKRLENKDKFIFHHGKFDTARILYSYGIDIPIHDDTVYLGYLLSTVTELKDNRYDKWLSLKSMAQRYLGVKSWDIEKSKKTSKSYNDVVPYLKLDCKYTYMLFMLLKDKLPKRAFKTYELLIKMANAYKYIEYNGVPIDMTKLLEVLDRTQEEIKETESFLKTFANINYNSPAQLQKLLFINLGLPIVSYTDKGQPATDIETLKTLDGKHPIIEHIIKLRGLNKKKSFLESWRDNAVIHNVKECSKYYLHPTFNLHSTVTGRTSSSNPNFQQIPRDKELKSIFCSNDSDWLFVCADYSQAELRFAALIADVKEMKRAYLAGEDLHTNIAAVVNGIPKKEVTKEQRTAAKAVNFGFLYGMSAASFVNYAKQSYGVIISQEDANRFREHYFELYPELQDYYIKVDDELWNYGTQSSVMQRDYIVDIEKYRNKYKHQEMYRAAINFPVQSSASDYVLCALYSIMTDEKLKGHIKVCGTVHDSIIMLVKRDINEKATAKKLRYIKDIMQKPPLAKEYLTINIDIPIVVDIEVGPFGKGVSIEEWLMSEDLPF